MNDRVDVTCPCCGTHLVVEPRTGEILAAERPQIDSTRTFDAALDELRSGSKRRQEAFSKAFDRTQHLPDLLEKKFEEARKKAARDPAAKPRNPFDEE